MLRYRQRVVIDMKCFICGREIEARQKRTIVIGENVPTGDDFVFEKMRGRSCHTACLTVEEQAKLILEQAGGKDGET